jgi:hypothetical protein
MPNEVDQRETIEMLAVMLKEEKRLCKSYQNIAEQQLKEIERLKQMVITLGGRP